MGDNEDAQPLGSDEDEELDEDGSPIEMTLVNRRQKEGLGRRGNNRRSRKRGSAERGSEGPSPSGANSSTQESKELKLFDQADEDSEEGGAALDPQTVSNAAAEEYNPFNDSEARQPAKTLDAEVEGQAMMNEIDNVLGEGSDDDEFGSFV